MKEMGKSCTDKSMKAQSEGHALLLSDILGSTRAGVPIQMIQLCWIHFLLPC